AANISCRSALAREGAGVSDASLSSVLMPSWASALLQVLFRAFRLGVHDHRAGNPRRQHNTLRHLIQMNAHGHPLSQPDPIERRVDVGDQLAAFGVVAVVNGAGDAFDVAFHHFAAHQLHVRRITDPDVGQFGFLKKAVHPKRVLVDDGHLRLAHSRVIAAVHVEVGDVAINGRQHSGALQIQLRRVDERHGAENAAEQAQAQQRRMPEKTVQIEAGHEAVQRPGQHHRGKKHDGNGGHVNAMKGQFTWHGVVLVAWPRQPAQPHHLPAAIAGRADSGQAAGQVVAVRLYEQTNQRTAHGPNRLPPGLRFGVAGMHRENVLFTAQFDDRLADFQHHKHPA
nr:hypothetical protein [Tanacetum cinerariifolium]